MMGHIVNGIEPIKRILEHHLNLTVPRTPITSDIGQVYGPFYRLDESGYGASECGLPTAGFAHNREDLVIL